MRRLLFILIPGLIFACFIAYRTFLGGDEALAVFQIRLLAAVATVCAVIVALFGEALRDFAYPIRVRIEKSPEDDNDVIDECEIGGTIYKCQCHHLRVVNLSNHRAINDCRVWLKRILAQTPQGHWEDKPKFAVPRLMQWAPHEHSPETRTFSTYQVFDLGETLWRNSGFELTPYKKQGGNLPTRFQTGETRRLVFYVTADNYLEHKLFEFEIKIPISNDNDTFVQSEIIPITCASK